MPINVRLEIHGLDGTLVASSLHAGSITGTITLTQDTEVSQLTVNGRLTGPMEPGKHGFHIHENGALGNNCTDAGGHFNPDAVGRKGSRAARLDLTFACAFAE